MSYLFGLKGYSALFYSVYSEHVDNNGSVTPSITMKRESHSKITEMNE